MAYLFYLIGKSATGKDTIYSHLCAREDLNLKRVVMYTTRPARDAEEDGRDYYFVDEQRAGQLEAEGKVIEMRAYHTIHGIWKYFTVDDEHTDLAHHDYIAIGTLVSYAKIRDHYGSDRVIPVYIEVEDGLRLTRALERERLPQNRKYLEMCRRFIADDADYSEDRLEQAGITRRFSNEGEKESCIEEIAAFIVGLQKGEQRHDRI